MKKFFVVSDIHGFYTELIKSLNESGYDINNPEHILIVLGDIFDRGKQPLEIYNFLKNLPKKRRILIRGNHEQLLKELVERQYAESHDDHNGTTNTLYNLSGYKNYKEFSHEFYRECAEKHIQYNDPGYEEIKIKWQRKKREIFNNKLITEIINWIDSDEWCDYFETEHYIFVHSFIPVKQFINFEKSMWCGYFVYDRDPVYREDWRNATSTEWEDAVWGCPWKQAKAGLNKTGKYIVCGHWHTSDIFNHLKNKNNKKIYKENENPIFISKRYKLIALDTCTVITHKVNVLVLEDL